MTSILTPARVLLVSMETTARTTLMNVILAHASMDHARMVRTPSHAPATKAGWASSVTKLFQIA
jgi:hypothetical protein